MNERPPIFHSTLTNEELLKRHYAFPEQRKYPMPDRAHVLSAIKFFNYVSPKDEKTLAKAILKRMQELGMPDVSVGPTNRFAKYYESTTASDDSDGYLAHSTPVSTKKLDSASEHRVKQAVGVVLENARMVMTHPLEHPASQAAALSGATLASAYGLNRYDLKARHKFAEDYKRKHPGTTKSNAELKKMYNRQLGW